MRFRFYRSGIHFLLAIFPLLPMHTLAQTAKGTSTGILRGQVTDPTGAVITGAMVSLKGANGQTCAAKTDNTGSYAIKGLQPGKYSLLITADGFAVFAQDIDLSAGQNLKADAALQIAALQQKLDIKEQPNKLDTDPTSNTGAIILNGKDLDRLSDDPDELEQQLRALAGVAAGNGSAQLYIDGFTSTKLPPKSAIREIRINQDPFSAEYDQPGFGRIEIYTRPGGAQYHGIFSFRYNDARFNSRSPFLSQSPVYHSQMLTGNFGGPLSRKAAFGFDLDRYNINDNSVVNALILGANSQPLRFSQAIPNPKILTAASLRVDYQINPDNLFFARYEYYGTKDRNNGVGQLALVSQAINNKNVQQTLQLSDTQFLSQKVINETRSQYSRDRNLQSAQSSLPQISVLGAFTGGGNNLGNAGVNREHYELQNYTSMIRGQHFIKFGARLRASVETDHSMPNFNGTFVFPSLTAFQITEQGRQQGLTATQIRAAGGGAEQFSITTGQPTVSNTLFDAGIFALDNWKIRSNLTLSYGLRYETQNAIPDHFDLAPRLGVVWAVRQKKNSPKSVLRLGFGVFYTRFAQNLVLRAEQLNGANQQQFIVQNPDFYPEVPAITALANSLTTPTVYQIDPNLRAPYLMQTSVSFEQHLPKASNLTLTYIHSRGGRQLLSRNINAPLPGTFDVSDPSSGTRPFPNIGNIYQFQSQGKFGQNQLVANFTTKGLNRAQLNLIYTLNYASSNTAGATGFPSNQFDLSADYGRATYDVRHHFNLAGRVDLPLGLTLNPFLLATSGQPFNIVIGRDVNGDSIFNDRPAFATDLSRASVVKTRFGAFDTLPLPGQVIIPPNLGTGPALFTFNLRLMKAIALGNKEISADQANKKGKGFFRNAWQPLYTIRFEVFVNNAFNHVNLATPIGNLNSPLFGKSVALAGSPFSQTSASRQIVLRTVFSL